MSVDEMATKAEPLKLVLIAAVTRKNGVGARGTLPWRLPKEMAHFRKATSSLAEARPSTSGSTERMNAVIMGRKTWQSIPAKFRPLKGRINVVVSRQSGDDAIKSLEIDQAEDTHLVSSLESAVELLSSAANRGRLHRSFLIGGAQLWNEAMQKQDADGKQSWILDTLLITRIHEPTYEECDVYLPEFRTDAQIREERSDEVDRSATFVQSNAQDLDRFMGEEVNHDVIEEKGTKYSLQMWKRVQ